MAGENNTVIIGQIRLCSNNDKVLEINICVL